MKFIKLLSAVFLLSTTSHSCKAMEFKEGVDDDIAMDEYSTGGVTLRPISQDQESLIVRNLGPGVCNKIQFYVSVFYKGDDHIIWLTETRFDPSLKPDETRAVFSTNPEYSEYSNTRPCIYMGNTYDFDVDSISTCFSVEAKVVTYTGTAEDEQATKTKKKKSFRETYAPCRR